MKRLIIFPILILICGCLSTKSNKPYRLFPPEIERECYQALSDTEALINRLGVHKIAPKSLQVVLVPGEKYFHPMWAWFSSDHNMYIGGFCKGGSLIYIATNPNNPSDIHYPVLQHEMMHHWLLSNGYTDMHHYPIYDGYIYLWDHARNVTLMHYGD